MKIKERIKNAGFWVSLISCVFLILGAFGIEIGDATAGAVINGVCSLLVVLGIVSDPTVGTGFLDKTTDPVKTEMEIESVAAIKAALDEVKGVIDPSEKK